MVPFKILIASIVVLHSTAPIFAKNLMCDFYWAEQDPSLNKYLSKPCLDIEPGSSAYKMYLKESKSFNGLYEKIAKFEKKRDPESEETELQMEVRAQMYREAEQFQCHTHTTPKDYIECLTKKWDFMSDFIDKQK